MYKAACKTDLLVQIGTNSNSVFESSIKSSESFEQEMVVKEHTKINNDVSKFVPVVLENAPTGLYFVNAYYGDGKVITKTIVVE